MAEFLPSNKARAVLVDPDGAPYDLTGILGFGEFNPSDTFRILLVDADGVPYKATGGGGGSPGGSDKQVQFNDGGSFGGASRLIYDKATNIIGMGTDPVTDGSYCAVLDVVSNLTPDPATYLNTQELITYINPTGDIDGFEHFDVYVHMQGPHDNAYLQAMFVGARHDGTGTVAEQYGQYCFSRLHNSGDITTNYALYVTNGTDGGGSGNITNDYGIYYSPGDSTLQIETAIAFYAKAFANGYSPNPYYLWFDSEGVYRVKEDRSFDSVGQAIPALYNPQFTKYTPGATDFERVVMGQWNGNVAEIGTEKGGSGTQRALRLLGSAYKLAALTSNGFVKTSGGDGSLSVQAAGANFGPGVPTSITVVNGIVTAIS